MKESPVIKSYFAGMLMKDCPQKKPNHAELVLADPSPGTVEVKAGGLCPF